MNVRGGFNKLGFNRGFFNRISIISAAVAVGYKTIKFVRGFYSAKFVREMFSIFFTRK